MNNSQIIAHIRSIDAAFETMKRTNGQSVIVKLFTFQDPIALQLPSGAFHQAAFAKIILMDYESRTIKLLYRNPTPKAPKGQFITLPFVQEQDKHALIVFLAGHKILPTPDEFLHALPLQHDMGFASFVGCDHDPSL